MKKKKVPKSPYTTIRVPRELAEKMRLAADEQLWRVELPWQVAAEAWLKARQEVR